MNHTLFSQCRRLSSKKIRSQFLDFFRSHDHVFVPSSSVVPSKDDGSYFVNAGMNQFKPIFLGTTEPGSDMAQLKRAVNSQKCIRVGGKHNDLKDVGRDLTHHTFFEMLGSWSFGDYFKREACVMAWQLLTEVYKIPADQLLVTYFGGNTELGLEPDEECREIWLSIGVPGNRVFPLGMKDNFWDMGDCGPCGPCTEIHLNRGLDASANLHERLMAGDPGITELWNLVFMQFNRELDGSLRALPACHVDTGMGLERLAAVLQGVSSNYDTDLFRPIFEVIQQVCDCPPYGGATGSDDKHSIDTAYRIIADHSRMLTVAMGDGLVPGRKGLDARVRHIMYRAFMHGFALNAPRGLLADLVPVVVDSLGEAFPELVAVPHQMQDVIITTEQRYSEQMKETEKSMKKALKASSVPHQLSTQEAERIVKGFYGSTTNADLLSLCAESMGVQFDVDAFHNHGLQQVRRSPTSVRSLAKERPALNQYEVEYLLQRGVPPTDDTFKYSTFNSDHPILNCDGKFAECGKEGEVVGVILDRSAFYSEGGGQVADQGEMTTVQGCRMQVLDVQKTGVFVLHTCRLLRGSLSVGESVIMHIDQDLRHKSACNHTATHLLNFALRKVLDCDVWQAGSSVNPERLVFEFRSLKTQISADEIERISDEVNKCINAHSEVYRSTVALRDIEAHPHLVKLDQEVYPNQVAVISVGRPLDLNADESSERYSLELCGGTHVQNTADIGGFVISYFHGSGQGTKKVTALTGASAKRVSVCHHDSWSLILFIEG
ncbi:hypothetical protein CAPTEDRAFT_94502 [Capitella teleta]|uniref:Alanine--tRNA ligase n=1 Tax=Capitella teleta TaxID=283909 RepID=R7UW27_CAPTE|nr:hypothetical protein CAPTEDRAFT_94502 [Capitella teleta]|eukprot:ELU07551.1 hypothetical protein CAPTEDRAFT_94502 [Capitella teleta]